MAVYTPLTQDEIRAFLAVYALPPLAEAQPIAQGIENTNYRLRLEDDTRLILTLFEKRVQPADLPFFVRLMEHVAGCGVPAPSPVRGRDGNAIRLVKGKSALMVSFLDGQESSRITPEQMRALGQAIARFHLAAATYKAMRRNDLSIEAWPALLARIQPKLDPALAGVMQAEIAHLSPRWPQELPAGIIHGDLFPDNVFFDAAGEVSGIIDFYFACSDFLAYELAICLNAWCFTPQGRFLPKHAHAFLAAYHALRPVTAAERQALPTLARGAALRFLLTRAHDAVMPVAGALVTPKDPEEYRVKLRFFQQPEWYEGLAW